MGLSIKKIIELSAKIHSIESTKGLLPRPTEGKDRESLISDKTIQNYKPFTPEEKQFMQENNGLFPQDQYPKMHGWLKDTSKVLGDKFKNAEPAIKPNSEYPHLATLRLYTTLSGEAHFFNEENLKDLHNRLDQFIGKDDLYKVNKLIESMAASDAKQPIHDFYIKLNLPAVGKKWDKEKWYDLVVKTSPRALLYLARADEIETHLGGVPKTLEEASKALGEIAYPGSKEKIAAVANLPEGVSQKDLADYTALCVGKGIKPATYYHGLDILLGKEFEYEGKPTKIKSKTNIPSVAIDGKDIAEKYGDPELAKYSLKVLEPQDWRMLVMGELTNCCQSIGNHGAKCALEAMTNENCGVVAIFKGDKIVGQSFVWLGQDDEKGQKTFVFDSWERLSPDLNFLCAPFYNEMAGKLSAEHGINKVTLGTGGNTPNSMLFKEDKNPVQYRDKDSPYYDSADQYVISDIVNRIQPKDNLQKIKDINDKIKFINLLKPENNAITPSDELWIQQYLKDTISKMPDINIADYNGYSLLGLAAKSGNTKVVKLLLDKGADIDVRDNHGQTPLHLAALDGHTEIVKELLKHKDVNVNAKDRDGHTPLHLATRGHKKVVKLLIEKGANVNVEGNFGDTPLHLAIERDQIDLVKILIEKGANVNIFDQYDQTPLHLAVARGHAEAVKLLIEKGANVNMVHKYIKAPLYMSILENKIEMIKLLIESGANINMLDQHGHTPLHLAAYRGKTEMIKLLIESGANVNAKDGDGKTPADAAETPEIKQLIEDHIKARAEQQRLLVAASNQTPDAALGSTAIPSEDTKAKINSDQVQLPIVQPVRAR